MASEETLVLDAERMFLLAAEVEVSEHLQDFTLVREAANLLYALASTLTPERVHLGIAALLRGAGLMPNLDSAADIVSECVKLVLHAAGSPAHGDKVPIGEQAEMVKEVIFSPRCLWVVIGCPNRAGTAFLRHKLKAARGLTVIPPAAEGEE